VPITTDRRKLAFVALVALAFIWGYNWVAIKIGVQNASPFVFAAMRTFGGGLVLLLVALIARRRSLRPPFPLQTFLIGFFQTAGFIGLATWAVVNSGAGQVAMLAYTMPLWVALIAWPVLGERIGVRQGVAIAIAFAGIACMVGPLRASGFSDVLAVTAGLMWAIGIVIAKVMQRRTRVDVFALTMWQLLFGGLVLVVLAWIVPSHPIVWDRSFVFAISYNIVAATALAYLLFLFVLDVLPARDASMGTLANPVLGVLFGWLQLGETPTPLAGIGMLLIVAGLIALSLTPGEAQRIADDKQAG
jgi:drug/metabolite transporter (DMT)-like permease